MRSVFLTFAAAAALTAPAVAQPSPPPLIGVTRAVAAAEASLSAHAMDAELETRNGRLVYEVELMRRNTAIEALIDARTGKLVSASKPRFQGWWSDWVDSDRAAFIRAASPLAPRLAALEREAKGKVQEVSFDTENGVPLYEVEIATDAGVAEVQLDARTGRRLAMMLDD